MEENPHDPISEDDFNNCVRSAEDLLPIEIDEVHIVLIGDDTVLALLEKGDETKQICLDQSDSGMATYIKAGLAAESHIQKIHQRHLAFLERIGYIMKSSCLESLEGDILYGRIIFEHENNHRQFLESTTGSEAIIFSLLTNTPLIVLKRVWDMLDDFEHDLEAIYDEYDDEYDDEE